MRAKGEIPLPRQKKTQKNQQQTNQKTTGGDKFPVYSIFRYILININFLTCSVN